MEKIKLYDDMYYCGSAISYDEDTGKYEIVFGHKDDDGVDCISAVHCDTIDNAILFINKRYNDEFEDDDDACDYAYERWGD